MTFVRSRLAQSLASALADGDWQRVRELDTPKARLSDADFESGWGALEQSTMLPVRSSPDGSVTRWRLGLVAHELDDGARVTTAFCVNWDVDLDAGSVIQTGVGSLRLDDQTGWVDPIDMAPQFAARC